MEPLQAKSQKLCKHSDDTLGADLRIISFRYPSSFEDETMTRCLDGSNTSNCKMLPRNFGLGRSIQHLHAGLLKPQDEWRETRRFARSRRLLQVVPQGYHKSEMAQLIALIKSQCTTIRRRVYRISHLRRSDVRCQRWDKVN